jgi:hypothetical protein
MDLTSVILVLAIATLIAAFGTLRAAVQAGRQVRETEISRKLERAPYLTFQSAGGDQAAGSLVQYGAEVSNIGRGPAINCLYVRRMSPDVWCASASFDLGGGDSAEFLARQQTQTMPRFMNDGGSGRSVALCQDQFGTCHMFDPPRPPQMSYSSKRQPPWAQWYREQIKQTSIRLSS